MAIMIPDAVKQFSTDGEQQFYMFIETVARPHDHFICWHTPNINGNEPDFILYSKKTGLVVFEVKDWGLDQIIAANLHSFTLAINHQTSTRKNPYKQAQSYLYDMFDLIKADGRLVSKDSLHFGNPKISIDCGVVFPNINKFEYSDKGAQRLYIKRQLRHYHQQRHPIYHPQLERV